MADSVVWPVYKLGRLVDTHATSRFPRRQEQAKQNSEKIQAITQEWFSKESAEPSRQALNDLRKDHANHETENGNTSPQRRRRSRSNTVNSVQSTTSRSLSGRSHELISRPSSQQSFVDNGMPTHERHDNTAKVLLARGAKILKRQGSKLNLLASQLEESAGSKKGESVPAGGYLRRQPTLNSRGLKKSISGPFAFQHLTHGDQAQFQSLNSVSKTDMTSDFEAARIEQHPNVHVHGMTLSDLPTKKAEPSFARNLDEPASPTTNLNAIPYLPTTPPKPQPPPKDEIVSEHSPTDMRFSRSMENFSRPTRLSVAAFEGLQAAGTSQRPSPRSSAGHASANAKPLPHLPDTPVVHAVSTMDDIALPLRTAPLPSPPRPAMEVLDEEDVAVPQHYVMPTVATSLAQPSCFTERQWKRRSQSSGDLPFDAVVYEPPREESLPHPAAGSAVLTQSTSQRFSVGVKPIGIDDWEDAVDDAWDYADPEDDHVAGGTHALSSRPSQMNIPQDHYLVVDQNTHEDASSSASTPLMMQLAPSKSASKFSSPATEEHLPPLQGLGIQPRQSTSTFLLNKASSSNRRSDISFTYSDVYRSQGMQSPVSMMSKSSSQESIIASIFGTHRSSNSSTSFSDFANMTNDSFRGSDDNLKLDLQDFSSSSMITEKHFRDSSQDTIRDEIQHSRSFDALGSAGNIGPFTTSPSLQHGRGFSVPEAPQIPQRKSSMAAAAESSASSQLVGRRRANTGTLRPKRNTRVSYSLFPTATSSSSLASAS